jgi:hypothetical protein
MLSHAQGCAPQESKDKDSNKELAAQGVTVTAFDASAENAADKLKGIDVLISTTGAFGLAIQPKLIHAAHKAGVKLFVPAEVGTLVSCS